VIHTPGNCCFRVEAASRPLPLAGDTLFQGSIGRRESPSASPRQHLVASPKTTPLVEGLL